MPHNKSTTNKQVEFKLVRANNALEPNSTLWWRSVNPLTLFGLVAVGQVGHDVTETYNLYNAAAGYRLYFNADWTNLHADWSISRLSENEKQLGQVKCQSLDSMKRFCVVYS